MHCSAACRRAGRSWASRCAPPSTPSARRRRRWAAEPDTPWRILAMRYRLALLLINTISMAGCVSDLWRDYYANQPGSCYMDESACMPGEVCNTETWLCESKNGQDMYPPGGPGWTPAFEQTSFAQVFNAPY